MTVSPVAGRLQSVHFHAIPYDMKQASKWGLWRYEERRGKPTKVPYSIVPGLTYKDGRPKVPPFEAGTDRPEEWTTWDEAAGAFVAKGYFTGSNRFDGLGFLLGDGWGGIDLDKCRNPETGALEQWASDVVMHFDSYTEISPSGTGLKIFIRDVSPAAGHRKKNLSSYDGGMRGEMEVYTQTRYFTVTGAKL